jgi:peptidoglycan/xylan/chitin deacetylase (PgdA/CDA1 family)
MEASACPVDLTGYSQRGLSEETVEAPAPEQISDKLSQTHILGLTFGSEAVLGRCWSSQELSARPGEEIIRKFASASESHPARLAPTHNPPHFPLGPELRNSIRSVRPGNELKPVALTFDLCETANEQAGYDGSVVDYLRNNKVKATFYAGGKWMRSHPERAMQLMADPLFEIGNHAWTHGNLRVLSGEKMLNQILWTQAQYELLWEGLKVRYVARGGDPAEMEKIPRVPLTFRFPFGTCSPEALRALAHYGLPAIQWDVVTGDPAKAQTAETIFKLVVSKTRPGSIIICHANGRGHHTAKALPEFVHDLRARGYEFVTISELISFGRPVATEECYELLPGDNLRYDRIFGTGTGEAKKK